MVDMTQTLARNWWAVGLRGLFALLFGVVVFFWPGIYATVFGILLIILAFRLRQWNTQRLPEVTARTA